MEKSIENIWKDGFLNNDTLTAPKINNIYNRKSIDISEKLIRTMDKNLTALIIIAGIILTYSIYIQIPAILYISTFILLTAPVVIIKKGMKTIKKIDRNQNSYLYLKSLNRWLKELVSKNTMLSRIYYPLCFVSASLMIWFTPGREYAMQKVIMNFPDYFSSFSITIFFWVLVAIVSVGFSYFAARIYIWDINLIYGRIFRKLDEIIRDMEELRG